MNRAYLLSATSHGYGANDPEALALGFPQKTLMQQLEEVGQDWAVFFELFPTALFMRPLRSRPTHFHTFLGYEGRALGLFVAHSS